MTPLTMDPSQCFATNTPEPYERMAQAIAFMRDHYRDQPDLATIAAHVHMSEYHFQRLFTQWAGISPKRFSQYLTVEYAKSKIAASKNLLDLTAEVGLSSPGRLHDLFVSLEAMSPGEFKADGANLQIVYGIHQTPFGACLIAMTQRGICNLQFLPGADESDAERILRIDWPQAKLIEDVARTQESCDRITALWQSPNTNAASSHGSPIVLHIKGTNFQIQTWRALLKIPIGQMTTYQGLATAMGRPTAARAVGNAVGKNPVGYLIPCHRVIRESGQLGGYRWGVDRKSVILGWEASR